MGAETKPESAAKQKTSRRAPSLKSASTSTRQPKKGRARTQEERRTDKLAKSLNEAQIKLCKARNYLRGFYAGFQEELRTAGLTVFEEMKVRAIYSRADKLGRDYIAHPPRVLASLTSDASALLQ